MRAIVVDEPGGPEVLRPAEVADPAPGPGEVLVRVGAAGVNRADLLQRQGLYPPPPGASPLIGLEVAGEVAALGPGVTLWRPGDRVCALLAGGGYAELVAVPETQCMAAPPGLDLVEAAAIPEAFCTAHDNLVVRGRLVAGETALVHGGASGVGTAAVQLGRRLGARMLVTAGSRRKLEACAALGAEAGIDYREEDFVARARELTGGDGVDVVLDMIGAAYLERNLEVLALDGRLVVIGLQGGVRAEIDLNQLMRRRLTLTGSTLRARSVAQKSVVVRRVTEDVLPGFADGTLRPVVDRVLPLEQAAEAHRVLEAGEAVGKVLLRV